MTEPERRRVALHELTHALVGRALGWRVRTIVTVAGVGKLGWCEHYERTDLSPFEVALDRITIYLAGEIGEWLVPGVVPVGFIEPLDDDEATIEMTLAEALNLLSDRQEAQSIYMLHTDGGSGLTDRGKAQEQAAATGGEEHDYLFGFCIARARRIVAEQAALVVALLPEVARRPIVTGDQLETLIQAHVTRSSGAIPLRSGTEKFSELRWR